MFVEAWRESAGPIIVTPITVSATSYMRVARGSRQHRRELMAVATGDPADWGLDSP
jgi:hypothetical protein